MMRRSAVRRVAALFLATSAAIVAPAGALGHADLKTPTPPADSVQTSPVTGISGIFTQSMKQDGSSLELFDAAGTSVAKGGLDPADDTRMVIDLDAPLLAGVYTVKWTSVATDGDVERGEWSFTVAAVASPSPSASAAPAATTSSAPAASVTTSPVGSPSPSAAPSPGTGTGAAGGTSDVLLPIVIALILVGAGAAYLLRQRNWPADRP